MIDKKELLAKLGNSSNEQEQEQKGKENHEELYELAKETFEKVEQLGDIKDFIEILLTMKKVLTLGL